jgi:hypothetical protein
VAAGASAGAGAGVAAGTHATFGKEAAAAEEEEEKAEQRPKGGRAGKGKATSRQGTTTSTAGHSDQPTFQKYSSSLV